MAKDKLKPKFDPIWQSDYLDIRFKKLSRTAFIMRQMYRSYRNPETNICVLSDLQIHHITGWDRQAIKKAREKLIALGEIIPTGYHSFAVKTFHQYQESCGKTLQPKETLLTGKSSNQLRENPAPLAGKSSNQLRENPATLISHRLTDTDIQIERFCNDCQNYDQKKKACPVLLCALPPFTDATGCENFKPKESESLVEKP